MNGRSLKVVFAGVVVSLVGVVCHAESANSVAVRLVETAAPEYSIEGLNLVGAAVTLPKFSGTGATAPALPRRSQRKAKRRGTARLAFTDRQLFDPHHYRNVFEHWIRLPARGCDYTPFPDGLVFSTNWSVYF